MEFRQSFILLRWLLIILACYLAVFADSAEHRFETVATFAVLFAVTNVALMCVPGRLFTHPRVERAVAAADMIFVSFAFYLLAVPGTYLHVAFIVVFLWTVIRRDLRVMLFSAGAVSLLYGIIAPSRIARMDWGGFTEAFLSLGLAFVVANVYVLLSARLRQDAHLSSLMREETRRAEVMGEITRSLSSLLDSREILRLIVMRLLEVEGAEDVSVVQIGGSTPTAEIVVRASEPHAAPTPIDMAKWPEMTEAFESKDLRFAPDAEREGARRSFIAVPMVVKDAVLGLIHIQLKSDRKHLPDVDARFIRIVAGTAANALGNAQMFEEMERSARTDFLTGLPNHRFFQSTLGVELDRAQRHSRPLSLLMIDLDYLKEVNDRFGHPSGDNVIRVLAETIRQACREIDFPARYGGEEFTVILPETALEGAVQAAERVRERIAAVNFPGMGTITASIGVSNYPRNAIGREDLIRIADQALYVAKHGGRDRVAYFNYQLTTREI